MLMTTFLELEEIEKKLAALIKIETGRDRFADPKQQNLRSQVEAMEFFRHTLGKFLTSVIEGDE